MVKDNKTQMLSALLEDGWIHAYPGRETAVRNELTRSFVSSTACYSAAGQSSTSLIHAEMQRLRSIAERAVACKPLKCISNSY